MSNKNNNVNDLLLSKRAEFIEKFGSIIGQSFLLLITSMSTIAVLFIFYFIMKDAIPFFQIEGFKEFFTSTKWYPSAVNAEFGCLSIFMGTFLVTIGAIIVAVPLGIAAAVCLSEVLPFRTRQIFKPIFEVLSAIPSVAYGFFALVIFAPILQEKGGHLLGLAMLAILTPVLLLLSVVLSDILSDKSKIELRKKMKLLSISICLFLFSLLLFKLYKIFSQIEIVSGTNALNASLILGVMALPTIVSMSEDSLQAAGRDIREGSYALGATRAETIIKVVIPASISGILASIILGIMRAIGETMVVWMASGNAAQIPTPFYNYLEPIRTLTATIAGDMGEADHVTGSSRYHVLFAMAFCLLVFSFITNMLSEWIVNRKNKQLGKK